MNERIMQFRVGAMVLITLLITGILVLMFGEMPKLIYGEYRITLRFDQAPGVTENTPVRKSGILIGRVKSVRFSDDDSKVEVVAAIQDKFHLRHNEDCRIKSNLLGDASLEFVRSKNPDASSEPIKNGETLEGVFVPDPNQLIQDIQGSFNTTIDSVQSTSYQLGTASKRLTATLERLNVMLDENREGIKSAIEQSNDILAGAKNVIGNKETQENLRVAVQEMPQMIRDTHDTVLRMKDAMEAVNRNLQNVEGFTKPLGDKGEVLVDNLDRGTQKLDKLVAEMLTFSQALNSSQGTVGQLVNNPELYQRMNRAAKNIEEVSGQLKPIVNDARVFSDKIARHPETLGVRGAIQKNIGIK